MPGRIRAVHGRGESGWLWRVIRKRDFWGGVALSPVDKSIVGKGPRGLPEGVKLMLIRVRVSGPADAVIPAFTTFGNDAIGRGLRVTVEDPSALAQGVGNIEIDLPNVDTEENGRAAVRALIDQVPGGSVVFTIVDGD
jgi:hypothetical protein